MYLFETPKQYLTTNIYVIKAQFFFSISYTPKYYFVTLKYVKISKKK
jgi:hypothetical protein